VTVRDGTPATSAPASTPATRTCAAASRLPAALMTLATSMPSRACADSSASSTATGPACGHSTSYTGTYTVSATCAAAPSDRWQRGCSTAGTMRRFCTTCTQPLRSTRPGMPWWPHCGAAQLAAWKAWSSAHATRARCGSHTSRRLSASTPGCAAVSGSHTCEVCVCMYHGCDLWAGFDCSTVAGDQRLRDATAAAALQQVAVCLPQARMSASPRRHR
jgi:hypothetical protein